MATRDLISISNERKRVSQPMINGFRALGGCRCDEAPVRYEYTQIPYEVHYCLCSDCTAISGGSYAIIAVVDKQAFRILQGEQKLKTFNTRPRGNPTCHRSFCSDCGCHMFLHVDMYPDHILVHVPTIDRDRDVGKMPDRWVFYSDRHPLVELPQDGLPRHAGWSPQAV